MTDGCYRQVEYAGVLAGAKFAPSRRGGGRLAALARGAGRRAAVDVRVPGGPERRCRVHRLRRDAEAAAALDPSLVDEKRRVARHVGPGDVPLTLTERLVVAPGTGATAALANASRRRRGGSWSCPRCSSPCSSSGRCRRSWRAGSPPGASPLLGRASTWRILGFTTWQALLSTLLGMAVGLLRRTPPHRLAFRGRRLAARAPDRAVRATRRSWWARRSGAVAAGGGHARRDPRWPTCSSTSRSSCAWSAGCGRTSTRERYAQPRARWGRRR